MHLATRRPPAMSPPSVNSMTFRASPPTRPEKDLPPARPRRTESFMTDQRSRKIWKTRSDGRSRSADSTSRKIASSGRPEPSASSSSSAKLFRVAMVLPRVLRDRRAARHAIQDVDAAYARHLPERVHVGGRQRRVQVDAHEGLVAPAAPQDLHRRDVDAAPPDDLGGAHDHAGPVLVEEQQA